MAATIRRLYLYLVAFISLNLVVGSVLGLIRILLDRVSGVTSTDWRLEVSLHIALLLVSGAVYVVHWLLCWWFACARDDRASTPRPVYLYGILAVAMSMIMYNGYDLLVQILAWGRALPYTRYEQTEALSLLANLALAGVLWATHWLVLRRDARRSDVSPGAATVRRLYAYGLSAAGLVVLILGLIDLLQWGVDQVLIISQLGGGHVPASFYDRPAEALAGAIVGGAVWLAHALWCQRRTHVDPDEQNSRLRHAYLYLVLVTTGIVALTASLAILKGLLDLALGGGGIGDVGAVLMDLNEPASVAVISGAFWLLHRILLWRDVRRMAPAPFQAHLRRLYGYLMAGIGLSLVVAGGANLIHALLYMASLAFAAAPSAVWSGPALREEIDFYIALLMVGLPVWLFHWLRMQREARPGDPAGQWRRGYLYLVFLCSALAFLFNATWVLHTLLNVGLGLTPLEQLGADLREPAANLVIYGALWAYHLFVLARDVRAERQREAERPIAASLTAIIAVVDDGDGAVGARILGRLQQACTGATLAPAGLTLAAAETMAAALRRTLCVGKVPADIDEVIAQVQQADVLVGPVQAFLARPTDDAVPFPALAAALAASPARRILLPLGDERHALVGLAGRPEDALAEQAARWALQVARGEEPRGGEGLSTSAVVGLTVLATLLLTFVLPVIVLVMFWVIVPILM